VRRIESNLATEPFLNRRIPLLIAGVLAALAMVATVLNLVLFLVRGGEYRNHKATRAQQQERLVEVDKQLAQAKKLLEGREVDQYAAEAEFAAELIERRQFSWTQFLDRVEAVKPFGVMVNDLDPSVNTDGGIEVRLRGSANAREELLKLEKNLLDCPYFKNPLLESEDRDGNTPLIKFSVRAEYLPGGRP